MLGRLQLTGERERNKKSDLTKRGDIVGLQILWSKASLGYLIFDPADIELNL